MCVIDQNEYSIIEDMRIMRSGVVFVIYSLNGSDNIVLAAAYYSGQEHIITKVSIEGLNV